MARLFLEIVTPENVLVSQEVDMVVAPGSDGEFGVLPDHTHFLTGIVPGELRYDDGTSKEAMAVTGHSFGLYTSHLGRCPDASGSVDGPGRTTEAVGRFDTEPRQPWMASIAWMRASRRTERMPVPDGPGGPR